MTTYMIDSGDGNWLANGGQDKERALAHAQELANERNETVTVYESPMPTDDGGEGCGYSEDVEPSITLEIGEGSPSECYPAEEREINGATDYDVTLTHGSTVIEGSITLYTDKINGGMCSGNGTPLDVWVSSSLCEWLRAQPAKVYRAVVGCLESRSDGAVEVS